MELFFSMPPFEMAMIFCPFLISLILVVILIDSKKSRLKELKFVLNRSTSLTENEHTKALLAKLKRDHGKEQTFAQKENIVLKSLGIKTTCEELFQQCGIGAVCGLLFGFFFMNSGFILTLYFAGLFAYLPWMFMQNKKTTIRKKLKKEFFYILKNISSQLEIGKMFNSIIDDLLKNFKMSPIIFDEFTCIKSDIYVGSDLSVAFYHMYERIGLSDVKKFGDSLQTFEKVGGNINKIIQAQTELIEKMKEVEDMMLIYENKLNNTLKIVTVIPIALLLGIKILSPTFFGDFFVSLTGQCISIACFSCMVFGVIKSKSLLKVSDV